jgi:ribosomal protein S18 acetylase RimI-like enzyme
LKIEFRQATIPDELRSLVAFDRKVFPADCFPASEWRHYESWWLLLNQRKVGCCAFEPNVDFQDDFNPGTGNPKLPGSLYIASTGILPRYQHQGLGQLFKSWQLAYAQRRRYTRIVTNTRRSNAAMIALNRKFGFRIIRTTRAYYANPTEATVVMECRLKAARNPAPVRH